MQSPIPRNEAARVAELKALEILDTPHESEYDDLVLLASEICQVPIATVSFIDTDRQWFKARVGLDSDETARDTSFCTYAVARGDSDLFVVNDATKDPRFADNPFVTGDPHIRFYAGAPLVLGDGNAVGTLCVVDKKVRQLTDPQRRALRVLQRHAITALELRRQVKMQQATIETLHETQRELEQARAAAERATAAKSQFLAAMSHEIRTPMNAVVGMGALLTATTLDAEQQDYVRTIETSGDLLLTVITDILDFSKIESGHLQLEKIPFDVRKCVTEAVDVVATVGRKKNLSIAFVPNSDVPSWVEGDRARLRQILVNLLANAVKFTPAGSITVRLSAKPLSGQEFELQFAVEDTGIGIPANRVPHLFQPFTQVDPSTSRNYGGTGLGLSISRRLSELHGGRMWVESEDGKGSCFYFTLRVERAKAPATKAPAKLGSGFDAGFASKHPGRILLAEDNDVNQRVATRFLEKLGYTPTIANNGEEALEKVREGNIDVVLMDVQMPLLDGISATKMLRAEIPREKQPAVIALTAHAVKEERDACLAAGMDDFITKPFQVEELTAALTRALDGRKK